MILYATHIISRAIRHLQNASEAAGTAEEALIPASAAETRPEAIGEPDTLGALDGIVGFHIRLAHNAVYRHFTETFTDLNLTQKQVSVLWLIEDSHDIAQADLGRRLQIDRATIMAIVNRLERRGFITRGRSASDGRRQTLTLTREGAAALARARVAIADHEQWLKARFSKTEVTALIDMLKRIHD